jgi:hypothetical protein
VYAASASPSSAHHVEVAVGVDQEQLLVGGVAGDTFSHAGAVDEAIGMDELAGQDDASRAQRMRGPVVVAGSIVAVPDKLHLFAHGAMMAAVNGTRNPTVRRGRMRPKALRRLDRTGAIPDSGVPKARTSPERRP